VWKRSSSCDYYLYIKKEVLKNGFIVQLVGRPTEAEALATVTNQFQLWNAVKLAWNNNEICNILPALSRRMYEVGLDCAPILMLILVGQAKIGEGF
jgi:hypothetical protein